MKRKIDRFTQTERLLKQDMEHFRLPGYILMEDVVEAIAFMSNTKRRVKASGKQ